MGGVVAHFEDLMGWVFAANAGEFAREILTGDRRVTKCALE